MMSERTWYMSITIKSIISWALLFQGRGRCLLCWKDDFWDESCCT